MKHLKYFIASLFSILLISCIVDPELEEIPKDFLSPEVSYTDKAGFESALAQIYLTIRTDMYAADDAASNYDMLGYDLDFAVARNSDENYSQYFYWNTLNADNGFAKKWWGYLYNWIFKANVIIDRADEPLAKWNSEEDRNKVVAEAMFLRAFAYHFLANLWGDVPLVLSETTSPKFDYTRAPQSEIYNQCKKDLEYAVQWMPEINQIKGGRAPKAAAYHLLTEIEICLGNYEEAITAADNVIDNSNFDLMKERFGTRKNFTFSGYSYQGQSQPWGDVYWDLFQEGNMNWSEGCKEAIWNVQFDPEMEGGGNVGQWGGNFVLERHWNTNWWYHKDIYGISNWLQDTLCGRPAQSISPTNYATDLIWQYKGDWDRDIRNSKYNIQREFYWTNPHSNFYGQLITEDNFGDKSIFIKSTLPSFKKATSAVHYNHFQDPSSGQGHDNGRIYKDWYIMRLSETYLLRAEAYFKNGDLQKAADDINEVRNRAKATPVSASDVNIDLILDERARELYMEEFRISTLARTGKLVEYLNKYNSVILKNGWTIETYKNKLPIPQSVIEANKEADMGQNTGY